MKHLECLMTVQIPRPQCRSTELESVFLINAPGDYNELSSEASGLSRS